MGEGFHLGIDFGTWNTSAFLRWPDGHARPLLFDGSPLLPSAVYAEPDGHLLVGRDAVHAARLDPARLEPNPKRRFDRDGGVDTTVLLGDQEVTPSALVAAVLARVGEEAVRVAGVGLDDLTVTQTHPAGWDDPRLRALGDAGRRAGLTPPGLVAEPVAAAGYFVSVLGRDIPARSALVVYDFGAGTFDASVVTPDDAGGYRVLAVAGLPDVGGVDLDAALLQHVTRAYHDADPQAWSRLADPRTPADRRHRRHLVEDVRAAKEMLSRATTATVPVPLLELEARVTREEFERLARPFLERTVRTTAEAIAASGLSSDRVAAVLLVGGSSRIPLVAQLLRAGTGHVPSTLDQPETVVAEGSLRLATMGSGRTSPADARFPAEAAPGPADARGGRGFGDAVDPWAADSQTVETPRQAAAPTLALPHPLAPPHPLARPHPPPVTARAAAHPTVPSPPPGRRSVPSRPPPVPTPDPARRSYGRRPRRWPTILAVAVAAAITAAGTIYGVTYLTERSGGPADAGSPPRATYVRQPVPAWLPAGWSKVVDDETTAAVVPGDATNGGTCTYTAPGVLHVERHGFDVSGCVSAQFVKDLVLSDSAAEATFSVAKGCGGMWLRTGREGYFVAVCADGTVKLHRLGDDPPSDATLIGGPWSGADPSKVVVGFVAQGVGPVDLIVYIDGVEKLTVIPTGSAGTPLRTGRVGVGGFGPHPVDAVDAIITEFRVWTPTGSGPAD
jgi:actin-like ATPase involved in cell morphogenesis